VGGVTATATYDAQDRLSAYGGVSFTYDANGALATRVENGQTTTYSYDLLGNLRSVTRPTGRKVEYVIDGANRRVGKRVDGVLVQAFLYANALKPIAELDGNGNVVSRFVYASNPIVPDYLVKNGTIYRIVSDHLGSPRVVVNTATGDVAQRMDFDEWGNVTHDTNPGFQPFGFAGGIYDVDTRLMRYGARDYDAGVGRWTSKDPSGFAGGDTSLYAYASDDPVNEVDLTGRSIWRAATLFFGKHKPYMKYGKRITRKEALKRVMKGANVATNDRRAAKRLGEQVSRIGQVECDPKHGKTILEDIRNNHKPHFHPMLNPNKRMPGSHVYFDPNLRMLLPFTGDVQDALEGLVDTGDPDEYAEEEMEEEGLDLDDAIDAATPTPPFFEALFYKVLRDMGGGPPDLG
jgi:RHS repeat-associated protein